MMKLPPLLARGMRPSLHSHHQTAHRLFRRQPGSRSAIADAFGATCFAAVLLLTVSWTENATPPGHQSGAVPSHDAERVVLHVEPVLAWRPRAQSI